MDKNEACENKELIDAIAAFAIANIPRLRGLSLCVDCSPIDEREADEMRDQEKIDACFELCKQYPAFSGSNIYRVGWRNHQVRRCMVVDKYHEPIGIKWSNIHGKKRKALKTRINNKMRVLNNYISKYNKYAGVDNMLFARARVGGWNWINYCMDGYGHNLNDSPWFVDMFDDYYDTTYRVLVIDISKIK